MEAITWLLIGLALLASEWLGASFDGLLPAALAALLISVLTALVPLPLWPQLLLFGLLCPVALSRPGAEEGPHYPHG